MGVKSTNTQLNKLKSGAKNETGAILRIYKRNFPDAEFPHELFLTIRQTTNMRTILASNI